MTALLYSIGVPARAMKQAFVQLRPSIIHAHFGQSGVLALPYARDFDLPLVVTLHGNDVGILLGRQKLRPKWWLYALSLRRLIEGTTLFLAASSELRDRFVDLGCPEHRIRVHLLGIDLDKFRAGHRTPRNIGVRVVMIGRLVEKKGFDDGIRAFASVVGNLSPHESAGIRLEIIGGGPLKRQLEDLCRELSVADRVTFSGSLTHSQVTDYLRHEADVLLAPSRVARNQDRDSGLLVAKEASACALPVMGTWHGGIPDIVDDGRTGYLVPEGDWHAMSLRLGKLMLEPGLRRELGKAGRRKMEMEYDIKERMSELEATYTELIRSRAAAH